MRRFVLIAGLVIDLALSFLFLKGVFAMSSTNYQINWDSFNSGGTDTGSSTNYILRDTIGEQATGFSSSSNYTISAGYRTGDQDLTTLSFRLGTQENSTQTAFSAFSTSSKQVTVASAAGFTVGDLIGVVENRGLSQKIAIGVISSISVNNITVDKWDGDQNSISSSPSGGDDFVYRMNGYSAELGTLSVGSGNTSLTGTRVTSNAINGYTVYVSDDGNLRYGALAFILNVADGSVTAGSEEYGWRVYGDMATSTGSDFAFAISTREIQQSSAITSQEERVGLIYKAAIGANTPAGNYSHIVYYTVTANY